MVFCGVQDKTKEIANLNQQLGLLDLKVVPVTADGNCFFRYIDRFSYLEFFLKVEEVFVENWREESTRLLMMNMCLIELWRSN